MDFREILVQPEHSKLSSFNTQLEGFEKLFKDKDLLDIREDLTKINKDEVIALCSEIKGYKSGFLDTLSLIASDSNIENYRDVFEELWTEFEFDNRIDELLDRYPYTNVEERIDYKLLEEYGTTSREEVARMIIEDLDTSSDGEAKKLFLQEFLSMQKRENDNW